MSLRKTKKLLNQAETKFLVGEFDEALRNYGLVLNENPTLKEARIGAFLSDLGNDNADEAHALFDYYQVMKSENKDADKIIDDLIQNIDSSKNKLYEILLKPIEEQANFEDGIRYNEFLRLIEDRGNFKRAFEDVMFSTRVILTSKDEFIAFITLLIQNDFAQMAIDYLDNTNTIFQTDQDILKLYELLNKEDI
jgi:tetratricopeptide (TPR) repeat protein